MNPENLPDKKSNSITHLKFGKDLKGDVYKLSLPESPEQCQQVFGSKDKDFINALMNQICNTHPDIKKDHPADILNKVTPVLHAIKPCDEFEAIIAAQIVATHNLSMDRMHKAARNSDPTVVDSAINQATKLSRTFIALSDALDKRRNGRQQKMEVKHVHVNDGGQAIVGNVGGHKGSK